LQIVYIIICSNNTENNKDLAEINLNFSSVILNLNHKKLTL